MLQHFQETAVYLAEFRRQPGLVSLRLSASALEEERRGCSETIPRIPSAATPEDAAAALGTGGNANGALRVERCAAEQL